MTNWGLLMFAPWEFRRLAACCVTCDIGRFTSSVSGISRQAPVKLAVLVPESNCTPWFAMCAITLTVSEQISLTSSTTAVRDYFFFTFKTPADDNTFVPLTEEAHSRMHGFPELRTVTAVSFHGAILFQLSVLWWWHQNIMPRDYTHGCCTH